jgi:hypothetical protein
MRDEGGEPPGPDRNSERDFHGRPAKNETHASTTDAVEARGSRRSPSGICIKHRIGEL